MTFEVFSDDLILEIVSDIIMTLLFAIVVLYLIHRDDKKLDLMNTRYDKVINNMLDTLVKQQTGYKQEIVADLKTFSVAIEKMADGINQAVKELKEIEIEFVRSKTNHLKLPIDIAKESKITEKQDQKNK